MARDESTELAPGQVLAGRYRVRRKLGEGGMGVVYEAEHVVLGSLVAIKVLAARLLDDPETVARFRREAESAARLGHPNIVRVLDLEIRPGEPAFFAMELLAGESLAAVLRREGRLSAERVEFMAVQVLAALGAAHEVGLVHRDVKPSNLMLVPVDWMPHPFVKLVDFGVVKLLDGLERTKLTATGASVGTPRYMAPEQLLGKPVDARTDLYSLGVTMFGALAGRLPFEGDVTTVLPQILADPPPPLASLVPGIDPQLAAVVARALAKSPADRFASAEEMRTAIERRAPATLSMRAIRAPAAGPTRTTSTSSLDGRLVTEIAPPPNASRSVPPAAASTWRPESDEPSTSHASTATLPTHSARIATILAICLGVALAAGGGVLGLTSSHGCERSSASPRPAIVVAAPTVVDLGPLTPTDAGASPAGPIDAGRHHRGHTPHGHLAAAADAASNELLARPMPPGADTGPNVTITVSNFCGHRVCANVRQYPGVHYYSSLDTAASETVQTNFPVCFGPGEAGPFDRCTFHAEHSVRLEADCATVTAR